MERLKSLLQQEDTVLFIGSGISRWAGLPSWGGLISQLGDYVDASGGNRRLLDEELRCGDLLQAASFGFDQLSKYQEGEFIKKAVQLGVAAPHEIHRRIVNLGPRNFITTNYDNLLEEAIRKWRPECYVGSPITNRQLVECAGIMVARSTNFIFKPHGDAADSESIILTREQYRQLLPGGEKSGALEALKTLLSTRPVVYIGFGLKDLDFIYLKDIISNTYKGGARDHYAIFGGVREGEEAFWRKNYGINLVNYDVVIDQDGRPDHSALIELLGDLGSVNKEIGPSPVNVSFTGGDRGQSPNIILALARHAARLMVWGDVDERIPLYVNKVRSREGGGLRVSDFHRLPVEKFLDENSGSVALIGLPGAGKTYAIKQSVGRIAKKLSDACLRDGAESSSEKFDVPLLVDMKLYRGDIKAMVESTLPSGISLVDLIDRHSVKVFIDGFNEMPQEYLQNTIYKNDLLRFKECLKGAPLVIGSRTSDGIGDIGVTSYHLDEIDEDFVTNKIASFGVRGGGRLERDFIRLLKKPFYFNFVKSVGEWDGIKSEPKYIYEALIKNLQEAFEERFGKVFFIVDAVSALAYKALDHGEETFRVEDALRIFREALAKSKCFDIDASDLMNWCVSKNFLIPYSGGMLAFFHQSVTEYLAAKKLAADFAVTREVLKDKVKLRRWDQALFLTAGLLPKEHSKEFIDMAIGIDIAIAVSAVRYIEDRNDDLVGSILKKLIELGKKWGGGVDAITYIFAAHEIPVEEVHAPLIEELIECRGFYGMAGIRLLAKIKKDEIKERLYEEISKNIGDYNFLVNGVVPILRDLVHEGDLPRIVSIIDAYKGDDASRGVYISKALSSMDVEVLARHFEIDVVPINPSRVIAFCEALQESKSEDALPYLLRILRGANSECAYQVVVCIYFILREKLASDEGGLEFLSNFDKKSIDDLAIVLSDAKAGEWGLRVLKKICGRRPDLRDYLLEKSEGESGLISAFMVYAASGRDDLVIKWLRDHLSSGHKVVSIESEPLQLFCDFNFDWNKDTDLLISLLRLENVDLTKNLLESCERRDITISLLDHDWWLSWLKRVQGSDSLWDWWLTHRVSGFFAASLDGPSMRILIEEFNTSSSPFRDVLRSHVLTKRGGLSVEHFCEDALSFLIDGLRGKKAFSAIEGNLLGRIADEPFITSRLLPLLDDGDEDFVSNLSLVIDRAGRRLGRRFFV
ncbi:SIR2 family protein [Lysobacter enzymogenes]|uniref:SIR2 family protein n=1 Tax=Lysobacter enzymogenes TaxID=69 RepID=UPI003749C020